MDDYYFGTVVTDRRAKKMASEPEQKMVNEKILHFQGRNTNLDQLSKQIIQRLQLDDFQTQSATAPVGIMIQAKKAGFLRDIVSADRAFTILIAGQPNDFAIHIGVGKWMQNLAVAAVEVLFLSPLFLIVNVPEMLWTTHVEDTIVQWITEIVETSAPQPQPLVGVPTPPPQPVQQAPTPSDVAQPTPPQPVQQLSRDVTENLRKLAELKDQGILTEEEFQSKTKEIENLRKLAELKDEGILTEEEFQVKRKQLLNEP